MIDNLPTAIDVISNNYEGVPYEAIEYLRNHAVSSEVLPQIIEHLDNAYFTVSNSEAFSTSSLWMAVVAEKHLDKSLIKPVTSIFTTIDYGWDFLEEQCGYLVGLLAEKYPEETISYIFEVIEKQIDIGSESAYLYLFDIIYFANIDSYRERIIRLLLKPKFKWLDAYVNYLANIQMRDAIPTLKLLINKEFHSSFMQNEIKHSLYCLENNIVEFPELAKPYSKTRESWKPHYQKIEAFFV